MSLAVVASAAAASLLAQLTMQLAVRRCSGQSQLTKAAAVSSGYLSIRKLCESLKIEAEQPGDKTENIYIAPRPAFLSKRCGNLSFYNTGPLIYNFICIYMQEN